MNTARIRFVASAWKNHSAPISALLIAAGLLVANAPSVAQTQLRPPRPAVLGQGAAIPQQAAVPLQAAVPQQATVPLQAAAPLPVTTPVQMATPLQENQPPKTLSDVAFKRFQTVIVDNKVLDLRTLPDSTVLKGKSGRTITVARIKQLQARMDGASRVPMVIAQKGQSLKSLAANPAGTLVTLPGGRVTRSQDLATIQNIYAKLSIKRVIKPIPVQQRNMPVAAVVGQGISLADAMKRPGNEVIQIGTHKYTAEQLRQMDALLKASAREPQGLLERLGTKTPNSRRATRQGGVK